MVDFDFEQYDSDTLEIAREEAQFTLEEKLRTFRELSTKAERLIYANLTVLVVISTIYNFISFKNGNILFVAGVSVVLLSVVFGMMAYRTHEIRQGAHPELLGWVLEDNPSVNMLNCRLLLRVYMNQIEFMRETNKEKRRYLTWSLYTLVIGGILVIGAGLTLFVRMYS